MTTKCTDEICKVTNKETAQVPLRPVKERYDTSQICYCFHIFREDIEQEIRKSGKTTVPDFLRAQIKTGNCRCEIVNPKKSCCLGDISKAIKEIQKGEIK